MPETEIQYVDMVKHLQDALDEIAPDVFHVVSERNLNGTFENDVVVCQLVGNVTKKSANIPYEFEVFSSKPDDIINIFTKLSKQLNNTVFTQVIDGEIHHISQYYNTPTIMDRDYQIGHIHVCRLVLFANLYVVSGVNNIKKITIDDEEIEFINGTIAYTTEAHENKVSGVNFSKVKNRMATLVVSFSMLDNVGVFTTKLFKIMTGQLSDINTVFSVYIEKVNGATATLDMVLSQDVLSFAQQSLPSHNISLKLFDSRGTNNA